MAYKLMKGLKPFKKPKIKRKLFYKYYALYLLPLIILHEILHSIAALILNVKILKISIFKNEELYNGFIKIKLPNKKWKQFIISYIPYLLTLPFFLSFFSITFFIISIYLLTTITSYYGEKLYIFLPSYNDKLLYEKYDYNKYLISKIGEKYYTLTDIEISQEIKENNLISYENFKQNKNKSI